MRCVALLSVVLAALGLAPAAEAAPRILYSVDAKGASVAQGAGGLRLSLPGGARVTWFTDRPLRRAGTTTLRGLGRLWAASGFAADPPNAALLVTAGGATRTHVVELRAPRVVGRRVSFRLRAVEEGGEAGYRHVDPLLPGVYAGAALFIDDAAAPPCGATVTVANALTCLLDPALIAGTNFQTSSTTEVWNVYACSTGATTVDWSLAVGDFTAAVAIAPCQSAYSLVWHLGDPSGAAAHGTTPGVSVTPSAGAGVPASPLLVTFGLYGGTAPGNVVNRVPFVGYWSGGS